MQVAWVVNRRALFFAALLFLYPGASRADVIAIEGHVTNVQATYMPVEFTFGLDAGNATCPVNFFFWFTNTDKEKTKAQYATILAALLSGKKVSAIYDTAAVGSKGAGNCVFTYLYLSSGT
jgi:hypothetical protein